MIVCCNAFDCVHYRCGLCMNVSILIGHDKSCCDYMPKPKEEDTDDQG